MSDYLDIAYKGAVVWGAAGFSLWGILKFIYRKSSKVIDGYIDRQTAASIDSRLAAIQCEVRPNGGNSLKDLQVKQMEKFDAQDKMLADILDKVSKVELRVTSIENGQAEAKESLRTSIMK